MSSSALGCTRAPPSAGTAGALGILLVVAGTDDFARGAFLPVVQYLRTGLGIADAAHRSAGSSSSPRWALSTEPHLCAALRAALPFFDLVSTAAMPTGLGKPRQTLTAGTTSASSLRHERSNLLLRHWVMGFKVRSLLASPWAVTIYLDIDTQPCTKLFATLLRRSLGSADLALTNENPGMRTGERHWIDGKHTDDAYGHVCRRAPRALDQPCVRVPAPGPSSPVLCRRRAPTSTTVTHSSSTSPRLARESCCASSTRRSGRPTPVDSPCRIRISRRSAVRFSPCRTPSHLSSTSTYLRITCAAGRRGRSRARAAARARSRAACCCTSRKRPR